MDNELIYIKPDITFYASFDEAFSDDSEYARYLPFDQKKWEFTDFFRFPKTFVIAEPGYGKTELLRQIVSNAEKEGKNAIAVEIKKIDQTSVKEFIVNQAKREDVHKTEGFKLKNEENVVVCLDALDEVKPQDFLQTVERIRTFLTAFDSIVIIISCRRHSFDRHKPLFGSLKFRYARIFPFSTEQVNSFLKRHSIPQNDINRIFETPSFDERELVIQTPRYLELLVNYIKDKGIQHVTTLTKAELFEHFIYKKLEIEDKKLNTQKRDLIKRVLEKLALIMEIYQTNLLKRDELMTFFDDVHSGLKTGLLHQVLLEIFLEKTLPKSKTDTIEFDNTEFQEYLAAKEITRLGTNIRTIFDLAVDPEIREIYPGWFNTLGFVVDMDISILKPLLDFGQQRKEGLTQDEDYHRLLTRAHVERLPLAVRKQIFEQVFSYYQSVLHWIPWDIAKNLAYYFDTSQHTLLKKHIDGRRFNKNETKRFIWLGNVAQLVGLLIERGVFENEKKAYWKQKLLQYAKDKNESLQVQALSALRNFKDDTIIEKVKDIWDAGNEHVRDAFLMLCLTTNPNHTLSIHYFVEGVIKDSMNAQISLYNITEAEALHTLLDIFIENSSFLYQFLSHEHIFRDKRAQFIEHLEAVWNDDIERKLQLLMQKVFISGEWDPIGKRSPFIKHIALLLKKKKRNYIFKLIEQFAQSHNPDKYLFGIEDVFGLLLEKDQVKEFINQLSHVENGRGIAFRTLQQMKSSERANTEEMYEEGRQYFIDEYKEEENRLVNHREKPSEKERLCNQFRRMLEPEKGKFNPGVFRFYLSNRNTLEPLSKEEEERFKNLIESIFENFDPGQQKLTITEEKDGKRTYTTDSWIRFFGDCIRVTKELSLDIKKYRQKIIHYIPFAYQGDLEAILSLVNDIQPEKIRTLLAIYKKKDSDLWRFMPDSFIRVCKRFMIREAAPILREFVEQEDFSIYERIDALETAEFLRPNANFLNKILEQYRNNTKELKTLTEKANAFLITNHRDEAAIAWRFHELKQRVTPCDKLNKKETPIEHNRRYQEFARPIMTLEEPKYEKQFFDLLDYSFQLLDNHEYQAYAEYLWGIVSAYFNNRKKERSYAPVRTLEAFVEEHSSEEGVNWFKYRLKNLKHAYLSELGKPTSINQCIQKYNELKTRQYLKIATPDDLFETVKDILDKNLRRWVESEGAYRFIVGEKIKDAHKQDYEDLIQKTIKPQIENAFLKRGFDKVDIKRESQLLSDKRVDFLISYGFIGPILIEVKLTTNPDLAPNKKFENQKSYKNLQRYMKGYNAHFGIFLVFDNKQRTGRTEKWEAHLQGITEAYKQIEHVEVIGLACSQI